MISMPSTVYVDDIREIKEENPFESMMSRFDRAAQLLNLDADLYAVMRVPNRELKVYIPTRMDSGRIQVFEGYRVQHNFARGPAKGGIRYSPDVNLDEVRDHLRPAADVDRRTGANDATLRVGTA